MTEPVAETVVYPARLVRTLDRGRPRAEAVAIRGDRIRAVGSVEELAAYGEARIDDRFADHVIVPGFVEAHTHTFGAMLWAAPYIGFYDRVDPDGRPWPGCASIEAVVERLEAVEKELDDPDSLLLAWGFDAIYFDHGRLCAEILDRVSRTRPIFVLHASGHVGTVNTAMIEQSDIAGSTHVEGVVVDAQGHPDGELREPAAMSLARGLGELMAGGSVEDTLRTFASEAANAGCTTVVDLGSPRLADDATVELMRATVDDPAFPVRLSAFVMGGLGGATVSAEMLTGLAARSSDAFRLGHVKIVLDGSIQQGTARLLPPGYLDPDARGIWVVAPDTYREMFAAFHAAGALIHVHCNGDEATEVFLDTLEHSLELHPRWDHRHTVTHSQLTTAAQYRRLAALGGCANIFSNHIYYWGDQHRDSILGPDRAARMDAAATALRAGVPIALHCDTPVTPISPLATMHHAVNRLTATGKVLGPDERITPAQALEAVTVGGAYVLKMDHEVGSIEAGKFADLAVLDDDPLAVAPTAIKDVGVVATMRSGMVRQTTIAAAGTPA